MSNISLLWHDYETWGVDPRRDRASQFAAIRTNEDLQEVGQPINIFCKPADDFLPHPDAALITGITPQMAEEKGLHEAAFFSQINESFIVPGTCGVGYNSIRFDDEVTRTGFFKNFIDPYAREWQNGNSRWDIIDLVRMTYALRPEGIEWPLGDNGLPSFRLELLTQANGITHVGAHDALSDVRATIAFAKLIKDKKPKLYDFYFKLRNKLEAGQMVNLQEQKTVLHVSGMYPTALGCISPVIPLLQHPVNRNEIIVYDLRKSPEALLKMSSAEMAANLYCKTADLPEGTERIGLKGVHVNKAPALAPMSTLTPEKAEQWQIDLKQIQEHKDMLLTNKDFTEQLLDFYQSHTKSFKKCDAESAIYEGFINKNDRALCNQIFKKRPEQRVEWMPTFDDARLNTIYPRYLARNWPHLLNSEQLQKWQSFCEARLIDGEYESTVTLAAYQDRLEELAHDDLSEKHQKIVKQLIQWVNR